MLEKKVGQFDCNSSSGTLNQRARYLDSARVKVKKQADRLFLSALSHTVTCQLLLSKVSNQLGSQLANMLHALLFFNVR